MNAESMITKIQSSIAELEFTNLDNIEVLKSKVLSIYEQLVVLEYTEKNNTVVEEIAEIQKPEVISESFNEAIIDEATLKFETAEPSIEELVIEEPIEEEIIREEIIEESRPEVVTEEIPEITSEGPELLHELESITEGFELPEFDPAPTLNSIQDQPKSLNELLNKSVQIGLNDRIAFINQLFDSNQEDYTRVISQVNTMQNPDEITSFINMFVKPEYNNWQDKGAIEERFIQVVLKRFET